VTGWRTSASSRYIAAAADPPARRLLSSSGAPESGPCAGGQDFACQPARHISRVWRRERGMARTLEEQWFGCERAHLARWLRIVTQHMYINVHALDLSVQFYSSSSMCMSCTSTCTRRVRRPAPLHSHSRGLLRVSNSVCVFSFFAGWREQGGERLGARFKRSSGVPVGSPGQRTHPRDFSLIRRPALCRSAATTPRLRFIFGAFTAGLPPRPHMSLHRTFHPFKPLFLFLSRSASPETDLRYSIFRSSLTKTADRPFFSKCFDRTRWC
jgi:hypothetical protein